MGCVPPPHGYSKGLLYIVKGVLGFPKFSDKSKSANCSLTNRQHHLKINPLQRTGLGRDEASNSHLNLFWEGYPENLEPEFHPYSLHIHPRVLQNIPSFYTAIVPFLVAKCCENSVNEMKIYAPLGAHQHQRFPHTFPAIFRSEAVIHWQIHSWASEWGTCEANHWYIDLNRH